MNDPRAMAACRRALTAAERRHSGRKLGTEIAEPPPDGTGARGDADSAALRAAHHDKALHAWLRALPAARDAGLLFDEFETLRVEAIGARRYRGVARNLREYRRARDTALSEAAAELLERASRVLLDGKKDADSALAALDEAVFDQSRFARLALTLIQHGPAGNPATGLEDTVAPLAAALPADAGSGAESTDRSAEPSPARPGDQPGNNAEIHAADHRAVPGAPAPNPAVSGRELNRPGEGRARYRVYTRAHDEVLSARELISATEHRRLRSRLDHYLAHQGRVVQRLAGRLQARLLARQQRDWRVDETHGQIDPARLSRLVANPLHPLAFRQERDAPYRDTIVTLLIDNSRSMIGRPILVAAAAADILARTLERCGVAVEILGYTTVDLTGGKAAAQWAADGRPANPGRLNALRHIVFKAAEQPLRTARSSLAIMLKHELLGQNIDGEAIEWAASRLRQRAVGRRILMVISDGAPVDPITESANGPCYLADHLAAVVQRLEAAADIELSAIGIGHEVAHLYRRSMSVYEPRYLGVAMVSQLGELFSVTSATGS